MWSGQIGKYNVTTQVDSVTSPSFARAGEFGDRHVVSVPTELGKGSAYRGGTTGLWSPDNSARDVAHEFGHFLGNHDEYFDISKQPRVSAAFPGSETSIMGSTLPGVRADEGHVDTALRSYGAGQLNQESRIYQERPASYFATDPGRASPAQSLQTFGGSEALYQKPK